MRTKPCEAAQYVSWTVKAARFRVTCIAFLFCLMAVTASPAQTLTTLASFNGANGARPAAGLVQATDGNFYGTTSVGGANCVSNGGTGCGTVFKITPTGTLTTLYSFCAQGGSHCTDGWNPFAGLVQATDGNFYGTTYYGGANSLGTVFKITPTGTLTTLYSFCTQSGCTDGANPEAGLVQGTDGNFYGTTEHGGYGGTVFKVTLTGTLTTLYSFCAQGGQCTDGTQPVAGLVQATDGNFYGTTLTGGAIGGGTVFKITPAGTLTTLYSFCAQGGSNCTDGTHPEAGLVQGTDGIFYGTTSFGGANLYYGTVFKITPSGTLTTLYSFCDCTDGANPAAGLVQGTDGNFYGTTEFGGANLYYGTVFKITPTGTLTTLYSFCTQSGCADGGEPQAGLVQATDGNFYGTTYCCGANGNNGTVFTLTGPSSTAVQFIPVTPCRVVDTRNPNGTFGGPPIQGGTYRSFPIPQGSCNIPATSAAYSLNVTVVPQGRLGYLTIWPTGQNQPVVSTMNSLDGRIKANAAIVPAGATGAVSVYVTNTTNVVLDIDGYFTTPSGQTLQFYPLTR